MMRKSSIDKDFIHSSFPDWWGATYKNNNLIETSGNVGNICSLTEMLLSLIQCIRTGSKNTRNTSSMHHIYSYLEVVLICAVYITSQASHLHSLFKCVKRFDWKGLNEMSWHWKTLKSNSTVWKKRGICWRIVKKKEKVTRVWGWQKPGGQKMERQPLKGMAEGK